VDGREWVSDCLQSNLSLISFENSRCFQAAVSCKGSVLQATCGKLISTDAPMSGCLQCGAAFMKFDWATLPKDSWNTTEHDRRCLAGSSAARLSLGEHTEA
jgi:hypothetical protein